METHLSATVPLRYLSSQVLPSVTDPIQPTPTVYVIDDDEGSRKSIECLLSVHGIPSIAFDSARRFLSLVSKEPIGCIVTDLNMPEMSGLDFFQHVQSLGWQIPTIIITAYGEVKSCASAFTAGVMDYLEKPVLPETFIASIRSSLSRSQQRHEDAMRRQASQRKLDNLTNKELEVLELLVSGQSMKNIAAVFGTSFQAVSRHRQRILDKLGLEGDVALVRWVLEHRQGMRLSNN